MHIHYVSKNVAYIIIYKVMRSVVCEISGKMYKQ